MKILIKRVINGDIYRLNKKKAIKLCYEAHKNQFDKSGLPYVLHPIHLAEQMTDEYSTIAALLHDVVEDTDVSIEQLRKDGYPEEVLEAIQLLTRKKSAPYMPYVRNLMHNPIARAVKIADLRHNGDLTRLNVVDEKALKRVNKYKEAIGILTEAEEKDFEFQTEEARMTYELLKIATELDAREPSANCVISEYTGTSWKDLCDKAEKLIKQLKKIK